MYFQTSQKYKDTIYNPSVQSVVNIYIDDVLLNPKFITDFKIGCELFDGELELGSVPSQYIEIQVHKKSGISNPKTIRIEYGILVNNGLTVAELNQMLICDLNKLQVKSLAKGNSSFEIIPIGTYNVDDYNDEDDNVINIKALDNIIKLDKDDGYYDASELISQKGYATLGEIAQDICNKKGLELETSSFLNANKKISVYDNQLKAREYMSYIAECAGCFCCANRLGKIVFRKIGQDEAKIPLRLFKTYKFGEEHKISKVAFEDGVRSFKFGDETRNTLWIRQENLFVVDENEIENIYNEMKDLTINSFEGTVIIDPAIDIGDKIKIGDKYIIYQGEMSLSRRFIANISSKIQIKQKEETTVKKESQKVINRRVQSEINQIDGKITQLVEETTENSQKLTQHEQTMNGITDTVNSIGTKVEEVESKTIYKVDVMYALSNSVTEEPTAGWQTQAPEWQQGKYMWQKTVTTYGDETVEETSATCISGAKGADGINGQDGADGEDGQNGEDGVGIQTISEQYYLSTSNETTEGSVWKETQDGWIKDRYIWTRNKIVWTNGTTTYTNPVLATGLNNANSMADNAKDTANNATETANTAKNTADSVNNNLTTNYFTKTETNAQIETKADSITQSVSKTYSTKTEMANAKQEAINSANANTEEKLEDYTKIEELGTQIEQNYEHVKLAWNQISDFIQMMIINNNASFAILDKDKNVMMYLDKTGQHFCDSQGNVFGEMGVKKVGEQNYISFSVEGDYGQEIQNGMSWGVTTKDGKYYPILYITNFLMGGENSDESYGELVLDYCNLVLGGIGTGIKSGNVLLTGDPGIGGMIFIDTGNYKNLLSIYPDTALGYANLQFLDNIQFYRNQAGSNSLKIGNGDNHCLFTDEGSMYGKTLGLKAMTVTEER